MTAPTTTPTPGMPAALAPPPDDYISAWQQLSTQADLTATQRAGIATAACYADFVTSSDPGYGERPGEVETWCRLAVGAYQHLSDQLTRSGLPRRQPPPRCAADPARIRDWLASPSPLPGLADWTVAETWGIDDELDCTPPDLCARIATLVTQAQRAGVFGTAEHTISMLALAPDQHDIGEYLVLARHEPSGVVLASAPLPADQLVAHDSFGLPAVVEALTSTAVVVDELLAAHHRLAATTWPTLSPAPAPTAPVPGPASRPSRGFAPLDLHTPTAAPAAATPSPATGPARHR